MGGNHDDSGDDSGEDDKDNNNGDENPKEEEYDDPHYRGAEYHKHSTEDENGQFCVLLQEVLQHLGYTMKPLYVTNHFTEPGMRDYYTSRV
jgi:TATA-binding protein-associated factor Taf7